MITTRICARFLKAFTYPSYHVNQTSKAVISQRKQAWPILLHNLNIRTLTARVIRMAATQPEAEVKTDSDLTTDIEQTCGHTESTCEQGKRPATQDTNESSKKRLKTDQVT